MVRDSQMIRWHYSSVFVVYYKYLFFQIIPEEILIILQFILNNFSYPFPAYQFLWFQYWMSDAASNLQQILMVSKKVITDSSKDK